MKPIKNPNILLIDTLSDDLEDRDEIINLLTRNFGTPNIAYKIESGLEAFRKIKPSVVIVRFQELTEAESFRSEILTQQKEDGSNHTFKVIALCARHETSHAYENCLFGLFDDYMTDRPLYDPYKLPLAIINAFKHNQSSAELKNLNAQVHKLSEQINSFKDSMSHGIENSETEFTGLTQAFHEYNQTLQSGLTTLEETCKTGSTMLEPQKVMMQIRRYKKDTLERNQLLDEQLKSLGESFNNFRAELLKYEHDEPSNEQKRILIVDDEDFYREAIVYSLEDSEFLIQEAESTKQALEILKKDPKPSAILLDINLPEINGLEMLKIIRKSETLSKIPVIMLTGDKTKKMAHQCILAGANDYLIKPGNKESILQRIRKAISA